MATQTANLGLLRSAPKINSTAFNTALVNGATRGYAAWSRLSRSDGAVSVAFDTRNQRLSFGMSGEPPVDRKLVNPSMNMLVKEAQRNGVTGLGGPRTCCEFKTINNLLNRGALRENILYQVIDIRTQRSLEGCAWCRFTTRGTDGLNGN